MFLRQQLLANRIMFKLNSENIQKFNTLIGKVISAYWLLLINIGISFTNHKDNEERNMRIIKRDLYNFFVKHKSFLELKTISILSPNKTLSTSKKNNFKVLILQ